MTLECRNISFAYGGTPVLDSISLHVPRGCLCALLGRNGSGKTSLLHCLCGILRPTQGEILVNGERLTCSDQGARARQMSLVPQDSSQIFPFRVLDMVLMGRNPYLRGSRLPGPQDESVAYWALSLIKAEHLAQRKVNQLSGGERQLAVVARALAQQTPVMLLDEPSNHLDFHNQYRLLYRIRHLCRKHGLSVLAAMHDPNLVGTVADQVVLLASGRIVEQGETRTILNQERLSRLYGMTVREIPLGKDLKYFLPDMDEL